MSQFWTALHCRHEAKLWKAVDPVIVAELVGDGSGASGIGAASLAELKKQPIWLQLRNAMLLTRKGGAIRHRLLLAAQEELGGRLGRVATGGSHTPAPVRRFMAFMLESGSSTNIHDAYGSTEFPGIATNGIISESVELKLEPVVRGGELLYSPDVHDRHSKPRGEIVVRRKGEKGPREVYYWNLPEKTAETWDEGGWYRTGDVGELVYEYDVVPNSYQQPPKICGHAWARQPLLRIIDRVKSLEEVYVRQRAALAAGGVQHVWCRISLLSFRIGV